MGILGIIITILWLFMGLLCFVQNFEKLIDMSLLGAIFVFIMLIIFGPCFVITNVLQIIFE